VKTVLNSPRSLAACAELGIHPTELLARPVGDFLAPGVPEAVATIRFQHFETRRQAKLATLRAARAAKIEAQHHAQNAVKRATAGPGPTPASSSAAVPVSFARLKVEEENAKRRRQADLVRERAKLLDAQRERKIIDKQVSTARRVLDYRLDCEEDKLKVIELRRLRWADTREQMEHRRRAEEFRRQQRAQQNEERRKAFDKFNLAMARGQYLTPKAREERIRASSAQR
jgi:hypothetical protein